MPVGTVLAFFTSACAAARSDALTAEPLVPANAVLAADADAAPVVAVAAAGVLDVVDGELELAEELQAASANAAAAAATPAPAHLLDLT
ncbi:MAG TPA: hypothetical protein VHZ33_31755 [Trebonia sp.]|nr:hypothetical protein [Trebonia sp.]